MDKPTIFVSCHDRIQELLCYLDILKFNQQKPDVHVLYSGTQPLDIDHIKFTPKKRQHQCAVISMCVQALREARQRGIKRFCINNGDDWMFKHELTNQRFEMLDTHDMCGYNWFGANNLDNLAVNELYIKTASFDDVDVDAFEYNIIKHHDPNPSVEHEISKLFKQPTCKFGRLANRESPDHAGGMLDWRIAHNNRWFNRMWQLIGAHDPWQRWELYKSIRHTIPYHTELEQLHNFGKWFDTYIELEMPMAEVQIDGRTLLNELKLNYLAQRIMQVRNIPGPIAEFGVYRGGMLKLAALLEPNKTIYGFDTFTGTPADDAARGGHNAGDWVCPIEDVQNYLQQFKNIDLRKGLFTDTIKNLPDEPYSLVHVDADTYQSTRDGIKFFWPRMAPGGWLILDDYKWTACPGVTKAIYELLPVGDLISMPECPNQAMFQKRGV